MDAESLRKHGDLDGAEFLLLKALRVRQQMLEPRNMDLLSTVCALQNTYIDKEDFARALEFCRLTIAPYEYVYPPVYPILGLQYFMLAKLEWLFENTEKGLEFFVKAHDCLRLTHG